MSAHWINTPVTYSYPSVSAWGYGYYYQPNTVYYSASPGYSGYGSATANTGNTSPVSRQTLQLSSSFRAPTFHTGMSPVPMLTEAKPVSPQKAKFMREILVTGPRRFSKMAFGYLHFDVWKDTKLRYVAYADDFSECWEDVTYRFFKEKMGKTIARAAKTVCWVYTGMDALHNAMASFRRSKGVSHKARVVSAAAIAGDAVLFQTFASFLIPTVILRILKGAAEKLLKQVPATSRLFPGNGWLRLVIPAVASSGVLFMAQYIDAFVKKALDKTYWVLLNKALEKVAAPKLHV